MSGWAGSDRHDRLPDDWEARRQVVLARDKRRCQWVMPNGSKCGWKATDVDHIVPSGSDDYANLRALCSWHHARLSSQQGAQAKWAKRKAVVDRFARKPEQHPGSLV
jgi:hypothetical protein